MDWASLGAAGISAAAQLIGGQTSAAGAAAANSANIANSWGMWNAQRDFAFQQSQDQMNFQRDMSNTAYQRATADMKAAGLNPILAYQQGGASSPAGAGLGASGSVPTVQNTEGDRGRSIGAAATSALDAVRQVADVKNIAANNNLIKEQTEKTAAEKTKVGVDTLKSAAETDLTKGQLANLPQLLKLLVGQTSAAEASAVASNAAAGASSAAAGLTKAQTDQVNKSFGEGIIGKNAGSIWDMFKQGIPTPKAPTAGKNADIPGAKSMLDIMKGWLK